LNSPNPFNARACRPHTAIAAASSNGCRADHPPLDGAETDQLPPALSGCGCGGKIHTLGKSRGKGGQRGAELPNWVATGSYPAALGVPWCVYELPTTDIASTRSCTWRGISAAKRMRRSASGAKIR
jgi:hypothetical protein